MNYTQNGNGHNAVQKIIVTDRDTNAVAVIEQSGRYFHVFNMDRNGPCRGIRLGDYAICNGVLYRYWARYGNRRPRLRFVKALTDARRQMEVVPVQEAA